MIPTGSQSAIEALGDIQILFADRLFGISRGFGNSQRLQPVSWLRDGGSHGGGTRLESAPGDIFNRASINLSQVHYLNEPEKPLAAVNALSTIIHPDHPRAPSIHIHLSWTEYKNGDGYWRLMADLNPAIPFADDTKAFHACLAAAAGAYLEEGLQQGDKYFAIPALERTRGVVHFYLEQMRPSNFETGLAYAKNFGIQVVEVYSAILKGHFQRGVPPLNDPAWAEQRAYHTLYFLQVLTLDRGTTAGLLIHGDNDCGVLGSLPAVVDRELLLSWVERHERAQAPLLLALISALPHTKLCTIDEGTKRSLAGKIRKFYTEYPEALNLQASGFVLPPTMANHQDSG